MYVPWAFHSFAALADTYPFEEVVAPAFGGDFGVVVSEPVGVVGAIIPWNSAAGTIATKIAPALLAGCTVVVKSSPEAPGEALPLRRSGRGDRSPAGVVNVVTADREVSELLVTDPRVDKITFTGSTATGRRIAALCGERVARYTLELGGKSAAVILDDADLGAAAAVLRGHGVLPLRAGVLVADPDRRPPAPSRRDDRGAGRGVLATAARRPVRPGHPHGPLASSRQRDRVEGYIAKGIAEGATLATGGGRPADLDRGWFVEPTVFANVDNDSTIAREEIFGPVLSVIPADDEEHAIELANDTIYGLNASVFTADPERA